MRVLLVLVGLALLIAPVAAGGVPQGFREAAALEPAASWVRGAPVNVACGTSSDPALAEASGFALIAEQTIVLAPAMCGLLERRLARKRVDDYDLAKALSSLAHEAIHLRGILDESVTDCTALRYVPGMASRFFGFRTAKARRELMALAWDAHYHRPAQYKTAC